MPASEFLSWSSSSFGVSISLFFCQGSFIFLVIVLPGSPDWPGICYISGRPVTHRVPLSSLSCELGLSAYTTMLVPGVTVYCNFIGCKENVSNENKETCSNLTVMSFSKYFWME